MYQNWKKSLDEMYKKHEILLGLSVKAGIGVVGNIQVQIEVLESNIKDLELKINSYKKNQE